MSPSARTKTDNPYQLTILGTNIMRFFTCAFLILLGLVALAVTLPIALRTQDVPAEEEEFERAMPGGTL